MAHVRQKKIRLTVQPFSEAGEQLLLECRRAGPRSLPLLEVLGDKMAPVIGEGKTEDSQLQLREVKPYSLLGP